MQGSFCFGVKADVLEEDKISKELKCQKLSFLILGSLIARVLLQPIFLFKYTKKLVEMTLESMIYIKKIDWMEGEMKADHTDRQWNK